MVAGVSSVRHLLRIHAERCVAIEFLGQCSAKTNQVLGKQLSTSSQIQYGLLGSLTGSGGHSVFSTRRA